MKCIYCQSSLEGGDAGVFKCIECPINVTFITSGSLFAPEIYYTQFIFEKYLIELKVCEDTAGIYHTPNGPYSNSNAQYDVKTITLFDHIPDITPTNAESWLNRILNLKAFL